MLRYLRRRWQIWRLFDGSTAALWSSYCDVKMERDALQARCEEQLRIIGELTERNRHQAQALGAMQTGTK